MKVYARTPTIYRRHPPYHPEETKRLEYWTQRLRLTTLWKPLQLMTLRSSGTLQGLNLRWRFLGSWNLLTNISANIFFVVYFKGLICLKVRNWTLFYLKITLNLMFYLEYFFKAACAKFKSKLDIESLP